MARFYYKKGNSSDQLSNSNDNNKWNEYRNLWIRRKLLSSIDLSIYPLYLSNIYHCTVRLPMVSNYSSRCSKVSFICLNIYLPIYLYTHLYIILLLGYLWFPIIVVDVVKLVWILNINQLLYEWFLPLITIKFYFDDDDDDNDNDICR